MEILLNVEEAAKALRISPYTLRAWTFARKIPVVKLGRRSLYRQCDIEAFVNRGLRPIQFQEVR